MKRIIKLAGVLVLLAGSFKIIYAVCAPTDMFCYETGSTGNLQQIGKLDSNGNLNVNGVTSSTGNATTWTSSMPGSLTVTGKTIYVPSAQTQLSTMTVITATSTVVIVFSTGGPITMAGFMSPPSNDNPVIATATAVAGQWLVLMSSIPAPGGAGAAVASVTLSSGTASALHLGAATRLISKNSVLTLIYDSVYSMWKEVSFTGE